MISVPLDPFLVWLMVFLRTAFLFGFFPIFGDGFVMLRVRLLLASLIAMVLTPVVEVDAASFPETMPAMIMMIGSEAMLGFAFGLVGKIMFAVIQFSGQIAGQQMGFGLINTLNPSSARQISVVAEMQYLLSVLVFLISDFHHLLISVLAVSFQVLAPGQAAFNSGVAEYFLQMGVTLFDLAVRFSMPVVIVVFAVNMGMAMIGRAVPQVNIFLESFPIRIMAGLVVIIASLGLLVRLWLQMFETLGPSLGELLRLLSGG